MSFDYNILIVDDIENNIATLEATIKSSLSNITLFKARSAKEAFEILYDNSIDLILLDVQMPIMDGHEMAKILSKNIETKMIPIVFITAVFTQEEFIDVGFDIGAIDYIIKPIEDKILIRKIKLYIKILEKQKSLEYALEEERRLKNALSQERYIATHDLLTDIPNRVLFYDRLEQAIAISKRDTSNFSLYFMDLDKFKEINDTLGHDAGDELLVEVAKRLQSNTREVDSVYRIGGDEFCIIVIGECNAKVHKKILNVFESPFLLGTKTTTVHCSVGISIFPDDSDTKNGIIKYADIAMYEAKKIVGNTSVIYSHLK